MTELKKFGHTVHIWAPEYPAGKDDVVPYENSKEVSRLKSFSLPVSREDRLPLPFQKRKLYRQLDAYNPDIIHIQTEFNIAHMVKPYAFRRKIPVVQTCHTSFEQYITYYFPAVPAAWSRAFARWLTYLFFNTADAVVAPTETMKAVLLSYGITCPITVVPTGIPEEEFLGVDRAKERLQSHWLDRHPQMRGRKILLYVGRVAKEKNLEFLLDMLEKVRQEVPDALLVITGSGPYVDGFNASVKARGLVENVLCLGYVQRHDLKYLYSLADVFTFASVTETQGLVTIEAMMCGTPAVAVGKMGTKEVMGGDNGGFMVEEDAGVFAAAVLRLLKDPVLYAAKSAEAWSYARNWTAATMARRIEALYEQVRAAYRPHP